jgi:hypothetical protein
VDTTYITSDLTVVAGIIIYAVFEYQRREQLHREAMEYLKRDLLPPPVSTRPRFWTLVTTGIVCCTLLMVTAGFTFLMMKTVGLRVPFFTFTIIFAVLFTFTLVLLVRDIRRFRTERGSINGGLE